MGCHPEGVQYSQDLLIYGFCICGFNCECETCGYGGLTGPWPFHIRDLTSMDFDTHKYQIPGATPCRYQGVTVLMFSSVFKQKYDSHGIGVNLLQCLNHLLTTTVIGAL